jgi:enoyl-CoA hydratase/carnithine racemase
MELGRKIAMKPTLTLKVGKDAFYRQLEMPLEEAYRYTSTVMVENMLDAEAEEGIGAFLDKRTPNWPR